MYKNKKLLGLLIFYAFLNSLLLFYNKSIGNYFNILFWLIFLLITFPKKKVLEKNYIYPTIIIALLLLIDTYLLGFRLGFTENNHYNFIEIIAFIMTILGEENIRYNLIKNNKNNYLSIALVTFLIIYSSINFKLIFSFTKIEFFQYFLSDIVPLVAKNIFYSYLSFKSNYKVVITFRIIDQVLLFFLPNLPYSNWFIKGTFEDIKILLAYFIFKYFVFPKRKKKINSFNIIFYIFTLLSSIMLGCFMLGLFKYESIAILSNSMSPTFFRGDVVIYEKDTNPVKGDIIVFKSQDKLVVHRVVNKVAGLYITKGDANNTLDKIKVASKDVRGVYKFRIRYLGYPAIWLKEILNRR